MITIFYPQNSVDITGWKERLERALLTYEVTMLDSSSMPKLVDGEKEAEGVTAIEAYIDSQQQFVNGWYEDRCDVYEFNTDASKKTDDHDG